MNKTSPVTLPSPQGIREARLRISQHQPETPLVWSPLISQLFERRVFLKLETASPIASFKLRGALVDVSRASERKKFVSVATSSSGNHGQGLAFAARVLGLNAHVFLPSNAIAQKVAMVDALGATVHRVDGDLYDAKAKAFEFAESEGAHFVDDGRSVDVMEGAGTIGIELVPRLSKKSVVFVPVGDGALMGGISCYLKTEMPETILIGCQAEGAPSLTLSFRSHRIVDVPAETIADGISSRRPTPLSLAAMRRWVDDCQLVSDELVLCAMHTLLEQGHVLVEPASASALAAAWQVRDRYEDKDFIILLTGANCTGDIISRALSSSLLPFAESKHWSACE